jgi:hypothetical protein
MLRTIRAVGLHRGDVSVVNQGANNATTVDNRTCSRGRGGPAQPVPGQDARPQTSQRSRPSAVTMTASPRVEAFMDLYRTLSDAQQSTVRDLVELADRRLLTERLEASAPYEISAGAGK